MIGVCLLAVASGALFWRIGRLLERQRFESDVGRLKALFIQSRMMALNTKADWRLDLHAEKKGWSVQFICTEDPERAVDRQAMLGPFHLYLDEKEIRDFSVQFFSTGAVVPHQAIQLQSSGSKGSKQTVDLEKLFQVDEKGLGPIHPKLLMETSR